MVTLNHIASDIMNLATSGDLSYSFRIEQEQIYFWIHETRSMLISQAIQKRHNITDVWVQSLSCVELEQVDESECCLYNTGCKILRSKDKLPQTIETTGDNTIIRVLTPSGNIISKSNPFEINYNKYNKYISKKSQWFMKNEYLYVLNEQLLTNVTVYGLFEDPSELEGWSDCSGESCFSIDGPYPVSLKMANEIANYVIKAKVIPFMKFKQDDSNNMNNEDSQLQGNP